MQGESSKSHSSPTLPLKAVKVLVITSGHEVTDHRVYDKEARSLRRLGGIVTIVGHLQESAPTDVEIIVVPKPSSRPTRFLLQPWRCLWAARRQHADIIHFHDAEMLITLPLARLWWPRSKFVYDVHEDFANLMLIRDWLPRWAKPVVRAVTNIMEKGLVSLTDAIIGVTPPLTNKFRSRNRVVAYNYPSRDFFVRAAEASRHPKEREFDLVHLGTLNQRRALFLASTLQEFHNLRPEGRSLVIGLSPEIEKIMRERIPVRCVLMGKQAYGKIPLLLGNAKIGLDVHPWLGSHLKVALPVKIFEYMAAGCAVVSSTMPVLNRILAEAKVKADSFVLVQGGKPIDYARAVVRLVEAIDIGEDPGLQLRELALRHMVWEEEAKKIAQLYLILLRKPCVI